jgi:hypothetical protein
MNLFTGSAAKLAGAFLVLAAVPAMAAGPYVLGGLVGAISGDTGYGWDGFDEAGFRAALQNPTNFGPSGLVTTSVTTTNVTSTANLSGIKGLVVPWWFSGDASTTQVNQVKAFFMSGGDLFLGEDNPGNDPVGAALGIPAIDGAGSTWNPAGALVSGPFGASGPVFPAFDISYFSPTLVSSAGGAVGARDGSGNVTVAYWPHGTFCPTCGALIMAGDTDFFSYEATYAPLNSDGQFSLNAIAYLIQNSGNFTGPVGSTPPPTPAPASLWLALMGLTAAGLYVGYRTRRVEN